MKSIPLNNRILDLPTSWEDLSLSEKTRAFNLLKKMYEGAIDHVTFRLLLLQELTGYKPRRYSYRLFFLRVLYYLVLPFVGLYSFLFVKKYRRALWRQLWIERWKPQSNNRDIINYNLFRLSELIDFVFSIKENTIVLNNIFTYPPYHYIVVDGLKYEGKKFIRDIAPFTNITGREFADCFDLYVGYNNSEDLMTKERALNKMVSILFPSSSNYDENLVSNYADRIGDLDPGIKFGVYLWFSGIVEFYTTHDYYSILFRKNKSESSDSDYKINLGMNSVMLHLTKHGYNENDNLNHIFDAQIKILQDSLSEARAKGAKDKDIADSTGLSMNDINRLI